MFNLFFCVPSIPNGEVVMIIPNLSKIKEKKSFLKDTFYYENVPFQLETKFVPSDKDNKVIHIDVNLKSCFKSLFKNWAFRVENGYYGCYKSKWLFGNFKYIK